MTLFTIGGGSYELPENSKAYLTRYLARVRAAASARGTSPEMMQDIEERIAEQLAQIVAKKKKVSHEDVLKIVHAIGEPDEIFADFQDEEPTERPERKMREYLLKGWARLQSDEPLILGLCSYLAVRTGIPVVLYRLAFLILGLMGGFFVVVYVLLAIFLTPASSTTLSLRSQARATLQGIWHGVTGLVRGLCALALPLLRCAAFTLLAFFLLMGTLGAFALAGISIGKPVLQNQELLFFLPAYAPYLFLAAGVCGTLLTVWSVAFAVGRRVMHGALPLLAVIGVGLSFAGSAGVALSAVSAFNLKDTTEQVVTLPVTGDTLTLRGVRDLTERRSALGGQADMRVVASTDGAATLTLRSTYWAQDNESLQQIREALSGIRSDATASGAVLAPTSPLLFTAKVPFGFLRQEYTLALPVGTKLLIPEQDDRWAFDDLPRQTAEYGISCEDLPYVFDTKLQRMTCLPTDEMLQAAKDKAARELPRTRSQREGKLQEDLGVLEHGDVSLPAHSRLGTVQWIDDNEAHVTIVTPEGETRVYAVLYTAPGPYPDEVYRLPGGAAALPGANVRMMTGRMMPTVTLQQTPVSGMGMTITSPDGEVHMGRGTLSVQAAPVAPAAPAAPSNAAVDPEGGVTWSIESDAGARAEPIR